jgi:protein subunit release factor A
MIISRDELDDHETITVEIRPGIGGSESSIFSKEVTNMYHNYASQCSWSCQVFHFLIQVFIVN